MAELSQMDFSQERREKLADKGQAMPHGGYPIRNRADLQRAIQAFGRAKDKAKTKAWIIKRARELDAVDLLPEDWVKQKEAAHMLTDAEILNVLSHHGVKGMKWGVRRSRKERAAAGKKSVKDMSDDELRSAVNRMNMEQQYSRMAKQNPGKAAMLAGAGFVGAIALGVARSQITTAANRQIGSAIARRASREAAVRGLKKLG
jgi:hypothetical protein